MCLQACVASHARTRRAVEGELIGHGKPRLLIFLLGIAFFTILSSNIDVGWTGVTVLPSGSLLVALEL